MKMRSKLVLTLLAAALALPAAGFADEKGTDAVKTATAVAKQTVTPPADCKTTGKKKSASAMEKRKQYHANRQIIPGSEKIEVNTPAAQEHGLRAYEISNK